MFASLTLGVIFRYVLKSPLSWSTELSIICLTLITFIGTSITVKQKQSASVGIVMDKLPHKLRNPLLLLGILIMILFCGFLFYLSINWLNQPTIMSKKSTDLNIPMFYPYLIIPISFLFITFHSFVLFINELFQIKKGKDNTIVEEF